MPRHIVSTCRYNSRGMRLPAIIWYQIKQTSDSRTELFTAILWPRFTSEPWAQHTLWHTPRTQPYTVSSDANRKAQLEIQVWIILVIISWFRVVMEELSMSSGLDFVSLSVPSAQLIVLIFVFISSIVPDCSAGFVRRMMLGVYK